MVRKLKDGRSRAMVSRDSTAVLLGEANLDAWDDGELLMGRRRDKGGRFRGPMPKLLPAPVVRELQRRRFAKAHALRLPCGCGSVPPYGPQRRASLARNSHEGC